MSFQFIYQVNCYNISSLHIINNCVCACVICLYVFVDMCMCLFIHRGFILFCVYMVANVLCTF